MGRPEAWPLRNEILEFYGPRAGGGDRPSLPSQALSEASSTHRRCGGVSQVGHPAARWRAGLDAHEHPLRADAGTRYPLGGCGRGAQKAGKTPDRSTWRISRDVYVADTTDQARKDVLDGTIARDYEGYWFKLLPYGNQLDRVKIDPDMPDSAVTLEYMLDNIMIVGSPDDVTDRLRQLYADVGGFGVLLTMGHEWQPRDKWVRSLTLLVEEVLPRLADLH